MRILHNPDCSDANDYNWHWCDDADIPRGACGVYVYPDDPRLAEILALHPDLHATAETR